jgi:ADP-ribose pyrophosphatase
MNIIEKEKVFDGHYQLYKVRLQSKRTGKKVEREQFKTPDSVGVLVHDIEKDEIILVRQFRVGVEGPLLEIVAGKVEQDEKDIQKTVHREVKEEVGYEIAALKHLHAFYTTPGPVTELMNLYYAKVDRKIAAGGGVASENEELEIVCMSLTEFKEYTFKDAKTIMAQQWFILNH